MKKITLLFMLCTGYVGLSQSLPYSFDESSDPSYFFTGFDCGFALTVDPDDAGNAVGSISGSGANFDTIQTIGLLAENIDLSDDSNNTITFRWRPVNGTGSGTHLLKFEGSGPAVELPFTSTGAGWQNISIDFGAGLGVYDNLIIFPDFNNGGNDVYLIDDLAGGTNVAPPPPPSTEFPIDFEIADDTFICYDCGFSIIVDAGNQVGQVIGGGLPFDTAQLTLGTLLDLSDDANNTITFRIKPVNGTGSGSHLLKFEGGSGPITELPFTTTGTDWQDITLDFGPGLGTYDLVVIFTDFNNTSIDTYLIDDLAGGTNITPAIPPTTPAPTPSTPDANVFNLYSDSPGYTNNMQYDYTFGELGGADQDFDSSPTVTNLALWFDFAPGWGAGQNNPTDVSGFDDFISFQYYTTDATQFYLDIISQGAPNQEAFYTIGVDEPIVLGEWKQVVIPRSFFATNYPNFDPVNWFQYKFDVPSDLFSGTVYIDNLYFSNVAPTLSDDNFELSEYSIYPNPTNNVWNLKTKNHNIVSVQVFNILGKQVLTIKPNAIEVEIDASGLNDGIYLAKVSTINGDQTIKLVKN
ncbi:T9SS type A sorting domain-containing protein [Winogradskyella echinorum]|uniref:T9SS type A sorting domain-containing protein n=1 Tax=Winogradskyella echinorum TaxID=538189 RepID=A0ABR6Y3S4_9FLAO|nr:T9SS type A sorting domain-containing protein [Winogradskyella echinorum]MBC3847405.1 T9SS type A sorting domain-containing protein [Winogradskyella echinorum]MBC5751753.1 T9SS type A sorting domain-containing protein [Winogradskyella echinorum]